MTRTFTLAAIVTFLSALFAASTASAATYTYNNGNPIVNYYLNAGDSLSIASGTYTGQVNSNASTAKITVAVNASFNPSSFEFLGIMKVLGSATLPKINGYSAGLKITNMGTILVTGTSYITGGTFNNEYGATITLTRTAQWQNGSATLNNKGTVIAKADIYFGGGVLVNPGTITADGEIKLDANSSINNTGKLHTKSVLTVQNTAYTNTCRTIAESGIKLLGSTVFTNSGLVWASFAKNNSYLENQSTFISQSGGKVKSGDLFNFGTIRGTGAFYFTGNTRTQGVVGAATPTLDVITVYDATRTGSQIFDYQAGVIHSNVSYATMTAPDTTNNMLSCSIEQAPIPLPVKWSYFAVSLMDNTPSLTWEAEQDPGTQYEIQRSYDGVNFYAIKTIASDLTKINYSYSDAQVNTQSAIVYYRIKAIEPTNKEVYSAIRTVKFSTKTGVTVQAVPNPFTSQFTINFQSTSRGMITISVYSLNGQLQASKNATVGNGYNSIAVTEAAALAKGMYMVQITQDNQIVASQKLIKQ